MNNGDKTNSAADCQVPARIEADALARRKAGLQAQNSWASQIWLAQCDRQRHRSAVGMFWPCTHSATSIARLMATPEHHALKATRSGSAA